MDDESKKSRETTWGIIKYRLTMLGVVLILVLLVLLMVDGTVFNFDCSFLDFISFQCNRWSFLGGS